MDQSFGKLAAVSIVFLPVPNMIPFLRQYSLRSRKKASDVN